MTDDSTGTTLLAGAASAVITPEPGCWMIGPQAPSSGVLDDLCARVLVLDDGALRCAILGLDVLGFALEFNDELRGLIKDRTGISTVLINASHTHNVPFSMPWSYAGWKHFCDDDEGWRDMLRSSLPGIVQQACDALEPAGLSAGRAPVQVGKNRRVHTDDGVVMLPNDKGDILPWVDVLKVNNGEGRTIALLYSHAAHPVIIHGASTLISADYAATSARTIKNRMGHITEPIFLQGCGADINGHPLMGGIERAEEAGITLGRAALQAARDAAVIENPALKIESCSMLLPCQALPTADECDAVIERYSTHLANDFTEEPPWNETDKLRRLHHLREMIVNSDQPDMRFDITMLRIGDDWCLTAMPHEIFSAYALWIEELSPFSHNVTLGYTNGCEIYVPTDADLELGVRGGYEAACFPVPGCAAMAYHKRMALQPGVEKQIKTAIKDMWRCMLKS